MGGKGECYRCGKPGHWSRDCPKGPSRPRREREMEDTRRPARPAPYPDPYRDPYREAYYRDRYAALDRYRPYADPYERRLPPPPPRDLYYRERDPYARPPPEYYGRTRRSPTRDPYYDSYYDRSYALPPPPGTSRASPLRSRVAPY
ncbi:RNA-binding protein lark-like [Liolophura sinensis]|uniref:RNA-binding protein lark-like n=1 Tax=Liolophura sinensis TaxID=3198878 RepID=UPI0031580A0B